MEAFASATSDLFPGNAGSADLRPAAIERLWIVGSPRESKERLARRLLTQTVLLSIDDGRRLVSPRDHIAVYDPGSPELILLGPALPGLMDGDAVAAALIESFVDKPLRLTSEPLVALSFRGGTPVARLGEERTSVTTALHHATDSRSTVGRARACRMALHTLPAMDDALLGVFERERATGQEFDTARAVTFCENAREAFWRAGLERPRRSTEGEVRKLWAQLQAAFPFAEPLAGSPPRRLGYAADWVLGGCVDLLGRNAPLEVAVNHPRRVLGRVTRAALVTGLPGAELHQDVVVPVFGQARQRTDGAIDIDIVLESELFHHLGAAGRLGPRGPIFPVLLDVEAATILHRPLAGRTGEWLTITIDPSGVEKCTLNVKFAPPGLDMVEGSLTLNAGKI